MDSNTNMAFGGSKYVFLIRNVLTGVSINAGTPWEILVYRYQRFGQHAVSIFRVQESTFLSTRLHGVTS
jgi:hypothetical protein